MSRIWLRHTTPKNGACHTYESAMAHVWMNNFSMNADRTYKWVTTFICMTELFFPSQKSPINCGSFVTHSYVCRTYEWIVSRWMLMSIWMSHDTIWTKHHTPNANLDECWCHTYEWVTTFIFTQKSHVISGSLVTHSYVCHTYEWIISRWMLMSHIWMSHDTVMRSTNSAISSG